MYIHTYIQTNKHTNKQTYIHVYNTCTYLYIHNIIKCTFTSTCTCTCMWRPTDLAHEVQNLTQEQSETSGGVTPLKLYGQSKLFRGSQHRLVRAPLLSRAQLPEQLLLLLSICLQLQEVHGEVGTNGVHLWDPWRCTQEVVQ